MFKKLFVVLAGLSCFQSTCSLFAQNVNDVVKVSQILETSKQPNLTAPALEQLSQFIETGLWDKLPQSARERASLAFLKQLKYGCHIAEIGESAEANKHMKLLSVIAVKIRDMRTIPILIDGLNGHYRNALVKIGEPALPYLVHRFGDNTMAGTGTGKSAILEVFKRMGTAKIKNKNLIAVKQVLIKAANDNDVYVRRRALDVFGELGDELDIPLIEKIKNNDTGFFEVDSASDGGKSHGKQKKFIVREEASKALEKIKSRGGLRSQ